MMTTTTNVVLLLCTTLLQVSARVVVTLTPLEAAEKAIQAMDFTSEGDHLLVMHHCKLTRTSVQFMKAVQSGLPNRTIDFAMVIAPYNGLPGPETTTLLDGIDMDFRNVWSFLPQNAYDRVLQNSTSLVSGFLPPRGSKAVTFGIFALLESYPALKSLENVDSSASALTHVFHLLLSSFGPLNGFTPSEFIKVTRSIAAGEGQAAVEAFLFRREIFLKEQPPTFSQLHAAIEYFGDSLLAAYPGMVHGSTIDNPFSIVRAAIDYDGAFIQQWEDGMKALGWSVLPRYRETKGIWEIENYPLSEMVRVPRAITKGIEALLAPFEQFAYDGATSFQKVMAVSKGYDLYEKYVVLDVNDMQGDDIGAVQGFMSLKPKKGRFVTVSQVSTKGDDTLLEMENFSELLQLCVADGQEALLFKDEEASNQKVVRNTMKDLFYY